MITRSEPGLGRRVVVGAFALIVRQGFVRGIQVLGGIVLARLLSPADFGVYAIVSFVVTFFALIGDAGLGAAVIQRPEDPDEQVLRVVFTAQTIVLVVVGIVLLLVAGPIADAYQLPAGTAWLMRLLAVGLVVSSFRTVPQLRLERSLEFGRLSVADGVQAVVFQGTAIILAFNRYGAWSFGIAAVLGTGAGTIVANVLAPWRPGFAWDVPLLRHLLRFGLPFQGTGLISFLKDAVNPVFVGVVLGATAVGYVNWATVVNAYPVVFVAILNRLYFPVFARLQQRPEALVPFAEATIRWNTFVALGVALPFLLMAPYWTNLIFGAQWLPAVPLLYFLAIGIPIGAAATPGMAILNAFGRSGEAFAFSVFWMASTWLLTPPAVMAFGLLGFGIASLGVALAAPVFFIRIQALLPVSIWPSFRSVALAALVASTVDLALQSALGATAGATAPVLVATACGLVYIGVWALLSWKRASADVRRIWSASH